MDSTILVDMDIRAVPVILREFDERHIDLSLVMVAQLEEYGEPRLVLASPAFENKTQFDNYSLFNQVIRDLETQEEIPEFPGPFILQMSDPFVVALRSRFGTLDSKYGKRVRSARLGRHFVEDGYVFRIR